MATVLVALLLAAALATCGVLVWLLLRARQQLARYAPVRDIVQFRQGLALLAMMMLAVACSPSGPGCVPGESRACACSTGAMGAQSCRADGSGYESCSCTAPPMSDAGPAVGCGDGVCAPAETALTCEDDCPPACGDTLCTHGEDPMSCPSDCPGFCGDSICLSGESAGTCPSDCPSACGDRVCTHDETADCESDCRARCGDGLCTHTETDTTCSADCSPICGDSDCSRAGESCASCSADCGACLPTSIDVFVVGALIRAWDNAGLKWDNNDTVSMLLQDEVASFLASSSSPEGIVASIVSRFAGEGLSGTVAPDVYGFASLRVGGRDYPELTQSLVPGDEDAYQVDFPSAGGWTVPGHETIRVTVFLEDRDVFADDAIGTVDLDEEDLRRAWNESPGGLHWIQVDDQMTPILFVRVLVRETSP